MGNNQSAQAAAPPPTRAMNAQRQAQRQRPCPSTPLDLTLDEKLNAIRIDDSGRAGGSHKIVSSENSGAVSGNNTEDYMLELLKEPRNRLGLAAISAHGPSDVLERPSTILRDTHYFNISIPHEGSPITNQRSSGRCWIFSATNVFRIAIQKKYDIKSFELSQAYLFFWDKVEKSNYFLEAILDTAEQPVDGRLVHQLFSAPCPDGGQWDMLVNIVEKYGLVPQELYPDSWNARNSRSLNNLLAMKLREDGLRLRKLKSSGAGADQIATTKDSMMQDVVRILTLTLGPPPSKDDKFTWEYYDSSHKFKTVQMTPIDFAKTTEVKKFISLVNDPRNEYNSLLTVENLGNQWDGRPVTYVNVDVQILKRAAINMLKKGLPVFFGSDVGQFSDSKKGIMDTDLIDYELGFNIKLGLTKAQRLSTGESSMTHAMVLTAVDIRDGAPVRWRVENSWGPLVGDHGYMVMSDQWMDEFVYQIVVDPSVVGQEIRDILDQEPKRLPLWDPMGALA